MAHVACLRELSKGTPEGVTYLRNNRALANNLWEFKGGKSPHKKASIVWAATDPGVFLDFHMCSWLFLVLRIPMRFLIMESFGSGKNGSSAWSGEKKNKRKGRGGFYYWQCTCCKHCTYQSTVLFIWYTGWACMRFAFVLNAKIYLMQSFPSGKNQSSYRSR